MKSKFRLNLICNGKVFLKFPLLILGKIGKTVSESSRL